ncbi:bifunctional tRNA (5-methylaminomethyl-2-thiouridine)(34)-methyltransferase MnmD/FAD-dependent 5-carboxymethylaminomethyl-2-thiouridine(34) oxidoreductase MnmC [Paraburkholderia rhynchosiae]|uniref:tRNA 5-methylaminomethyl-2-thiouridine biosynthesis bifunctional protein MnmC n=1 Tax=Paraburkholderia rhynchosiae TaxID=487049 RepID=A0A2N7WH73_9BURK|nr:bifunctional tRNA (5-methylaminomethyl-2-thiouridine)(34)-methyltransferase MnmD/FAD-dependent 5-carboxymethylaminomethyl-2-thiouridine(34) oxidoreductase MnmC [Paraburkholderia rhynchosiae]PMS28723.1 bifunctional tRNA (5-methylaminomethyl-2-thiouridine)(34)-methyltransferase MnmD/FAD-dependent 5-carboxymethylaminomethyl-2-thiouridine(34) oxidoreductase MnmC [Paraburkholderia rhynchosiae]CAB3712453.1 tRNA 5-methylaminomethyl-2-thiouridine biosynthesis bifunctional protein MnmC [Paraburkholderi
MTDPLIPAVLAFRDNGTPFSPFYDDIYHSAVGGLEQANYVFLRGNALPERWQGRRIFTVLETGFGMGINFLMTWAAWRADPSRCERLHFVSTEKHPFTLADLRQAYAVSIADPSASAIAALAETLANEWPMLVPGTHRLEFDNGRVVLTLVFGDALQSLPALRLRADAFYLDGFAPAKNPELWTPAIFKSLARLAGEGATFATYSSAGDIKRALTQCGFEYRKVEGFGWKRAMLVGHFAPRWRVRRHEPPAPLGPLAPDERHAVVIGAGLAGCAVIERLSARGWRVTSLERHASVAQDASGNPAGVFHPMISRDDSVASRVTRAGFLYALKRWAALERLGHAPLRGAPGLLQIADNDEEARAMSEAIAALRYPPEFVTPVSADDSQKLAGMPLARGGWLFPHGGWIDPASLCAAQCAAAGDLLERRFGVEAARIERSGDQWTVFDTAGAALARAPVVIVASAHDAARMAGLQHAPIRSIRGQLTVLPPGSVPSLSLPVIGEGYAIPLPDGVTLTGATYELDDTDTSLRADGHLENIERVAQMVPAFARVAARTDPAGRDPAAYAGRVAFRCVTSDRMPMIGNLADEILAARDAQRLAGAWPLDLPRSEGLYSAFAYGSRGLVWAALGAELIASQIEGEPWPLERDLAADIDPARFLLKALRRGSVVG